MALIKCPECGAQISEHATTCPHCGAATNSDNLISEPKHSKTWLYVSLVAIGLLMAGAAVAFVFPKNAEGAPVPSVEASDNLKEKEEDVEIEITPEFSEKINKYYKVENFSCGRAAVMDENYKWGSLTQMET